MKPLTLRASALAFIFGASLFLGGCSKKTDSSADSTNTAGSTQMAAPAKTGTVITDNVKVRLAWQDAQGRVRIVGSDSPNTSALRSATRQRLPGKNPIVTESGRDTLTTNPHSVQLWCPGYWNSVSYDNFSAATKNDAGQIQVTPNGPPVTAPLTLVPSSSPLDPMTCYTITPIIDGIPATYVSDVNVPGGRQFVYSSTGCSITFSVH